MTPDPLLIDKPRDQLLATVNLTTSQCHVWTAPTRVLFPYRHRSLLFLELSMLVFQARLEIKICANTGAELILTTATAQICTYLSTSSNVKLGINQSFIDRSLLSLSGTRETQTLQANIQRTLLIIFLSILLSFLGRAKVV